MQVAQTSSLLAICLPLTESIPGATLSRADSGHAALGQMRSTRFDLIVTAHRLPDIALWDLLRIMRSAWPWQRWALVADERTCARDEVRARALGVTRIFDAAPMLDELIALASCAAGAHRRSPGAQRPTVRAAARG